VFATPRSNQSLATGGVFACQKNCVGVSGQAGETANIPANAPHQFRNSSERSARLLCMCSPAGQEEYFMAVGVPVASRVSPPPKLDEAAQAALKAKAEGLASQYRTEFLHPPV